MKSPLPLESSCSRGIKDTGSTSRYEESPTLIMENFGKTDHTGEDYSGWEIRPTEDSKVYPPMREVLHTT